MNKHLLITLCFVLTLFSVNFSQAQSILGEQYEIYSITSYDGDTKWLFTSADDYSDFCLGYPEGGILMRQYKWVDGDWDLLEDETNSQSYCYSDGSTGARNAIILKNNLSTYGSGTYALLHSYLTGPLSGQFWKSGLYYFDGTTPTATPITPPDTSSRIDSISVSTTTGKVNITGYWNTSTSTGVFQQVEFYQDSSLLGIESYATVNATTSGVFNLDFDYRDAITPYTGTTTASITSSIMFYVNLYQKDNNYYDPFGELDYRYSTLLDATSTSLTASTTNAWELSTTTSILGYPEYECGITSLTGCFKNAGIWLFYPSSDSIEKYNSFIELIQRKPPVGYFTIVKTSIGGLSSTSTSAFSITIPNSLKQYFFNPMDAGIAGILWIYFLFMFYKRLKHIQL
jgi:hypothetical protein